MRWVVKRGVCYLNADGANWFERSRAIKFNTLDLAREFAEFWGGKVWRLVPKGTHEQKRAAKDRKLGVEPLRYAKCDECPEHAYTRWYSQEGRREKVAYTLCAKHNDAMIAENKRRRKEFGLA